MIYVPPHKSLLSVSVLLLTMFATPTFAQPPAGDFHRIHAGSGLSLHKEMFMLPLTLSSEYNDSKTQ